MAGGGEEGERKCVLHGVSRPWPPYRYDIAASESPQGLPGAGLEQSTRAVYFSDQSKSALPLATVLDDYLSKLFWKYLLVFTMEALYDSV